MRDVTPSGWSLWEDEGRASKLNRALDILESEARLFIGEQSRNVAISITRTRWDEPELELRWAPGALHRSVLMTLQFPSETRRLGNPQPFSVSPEEFRKKYRPLTPEEEIKLGIKKANEPAHQISEEYEYNWKLKVSGAAWQDEDSENSPGKRIRRWVSLDIGTYPFEDIQKEKLGLRKLLTEAYEKVSALSLSDLSKSEVIPLRD